MKYVSSIIVENYNTERLRAFSSESKARQHIEKLAVRLSELNDAGKTRLYLSLADVFVVLPGGVMRVVSHFDGHDRGDGCWWGWK